MRYKILILFILSFWGLGRVSAQKRPTHTMDYSSLTVNGITISKAIVDSIQSQTNKIFKPLKFYQWKDSIIDTTNYGNWDSTWHGIIIQDIDETKARGIFNSWYAKVTEEGNYIYLTHLHFDKSKNSLFDIAIIYAPSQFDAVRRVGTSSKNYDISNDKVIKKLKQWDKEVILKIMVLDDNRVEAFMKLKPRNLKNFLLEIYEFSPAVVDNGYGSMEAMKKDYEKNYYFWLWWD